jgi:hypothetical protein
VGRPRLAPYSNGHDGCPDAEVVVHRRRPAARTLGELIRAKLVLLSVCRRCKHQSLLYPLSLIERFGDNTPVIDIRARLRCTACRYRSANLHEASR